MLSCEQLASKPSQNNYQENTWAWHSRAWNIRWLSSSPTRSFFTDERWSKQNEDEIIGMHYAIMHVLNQSFEQRAWDLVQGVDCPNDSPTLAASPSPPNVPRGLEPPPGLELPKPTLVCLANFWCRCSAWRSKHLVHPFYDPSIYVFQELKVFVLPDCGKANERLSYDFQHVFSYNIVCVVKVRLHRMQVL